MKTYSLPDRNILDLLLNNSKIDPNHVVFIENKKKITRKNLIEKIFKNKRWS